jgi:lipopolysaccharide export LptBFGC system permease protein LptF
MGTYTNRRQQRAGGMILSLLLIIGYWVLYIACEALARSGTFSVPLAIITPNLIFGALAIWSLRKQWNN